MSISSNSTNLILDTKRHSFIQKLFSFISGGFVIGLIHLLFSNYLTSGPGAGDFILFYPLILIFSIVCQFLFIFILNKFTNFVASSFWKYTGFIVSPILIIIFFFVYGFFVEPYFDFQEQIKNTSKVLRNNITYFIQNDKIPKGFYETSSQKDKYGGEFKLLKSLKDTKEFKLYQDSIFNNPDNIEFQGDPKYKSIYINDCGYCYYIEDGTYYDLAKTQSGEELKRESKAIFSVTVKNPSAKASEDFLSLNR